MSDKSKASHKKHKMTEGKKICSVGGQALMEGIMMLGPHGMAQVVRDPEGELVIKKQEITPWVRKTNFSACRSYAAALRWSIPCAGA